MKRSTLARLEWLASHIHDAVLGGCFDGDLEDHVTELVVIVEREVVDGDERDHLRRVRRCGRASAPRQRSSMRRRFDA